MVRPKIMERDLTFFRFFLICDGLPPDCICCSRHRSTPTGNETDQAMLPYWPVGASFSQLHDGLGITLNRDVTRSLNLLPAPNLLCRSRRSIPRMVDATQWCQPANLWRLGRGQSHGHRAQLGLSLGEAQIENHGDSPFEETRHQQE
jgi:hypothetical protein